jgi:diguanylate cyclase (GGDEF)-like protein
MPMDPVQRRADDLRERKRPYSLPPRYPALPGWPLPCGDGWRGVLLGALGLALVGGIALFDHWTGPDLSFGVFYFLPIAAVAWWGGFAHGLLLSVAAAAAWHAVDTLDGSALSPAVRTWNDLIRFGVFVISSSLLTRLRVAMLHERLLARTDPLTGAANARTFYEALGAEARWSREVGRPLTLAYLDLDNFKQLNDRLGHSAGDLALRHLALAIRRGIRTVDILARLGGDEFALLLPETDSAAAMQVLTRIHQLLTQEMAGEGWAVTASVGAATFLQPPVDVDLMLRRVDSLMYTVKRRGKNRVEHEEVEADGDADAARPGVERRTAERRPSGRPARVWSEELGGGGELPATVRDISAGGVGLSLRHHLAPGSLVMIEPEGGQGAKALLARVVRSVAEEGGWFHGCLLYTQLREDELDDWCSEHRPEPVAPAEPEGLSRAGQPLAGEP